MRPRTLAMRMVSRCRVTSKGLATPSRSSVSVTLVPGAPRSGPWLSSSSPSTGLPSTAVMTSPDLMPARAVGLLVEGLRIVLFQVRAVRIQVEQQSLDRRLHQLAIGHRIDVRLAHRVEHADEAADLVQRHLRRRGFGGIGI